MSVRIITDSASDVTQDTAEKWNIRVLPLTVRFGDEEFKDGVTIDYDTFYNRLIESDTLPKTSQVTPYMYENAFRKALSDGDDVICITISSRLSGCFQSASIAADDMEDDFEKSGHHIYVFDTMQVCGAQYILTERAVQLRDRGMIARDIVADLEECKKRVHLITLFDTLEYLKLGGRISAAAAFAGGILSIKPVLTVHNGEVIAIGKARGSKNGNNMLMEFVRERGGIDFSMPYCISWSGLSDVQVQKYIRDSHSLYDCDPEDLPVLRVGPAVGVYAGPGAFAFSFFSPEHH